VPCKKTSGINENIAYNNSSNFYVTIQTQVMIADNDQLIHVMCRGGEGSHTSAILKFVSFEGRE